MTQFCSFTGQHSFRHNPDSFSYPCINISSVSHTCSEHIILHMPKTRKLVITVECRGQETGPYLIFTWWLVGLQCDFKWRKWRKKNEICEKRKFHFLTHRPTSATSIRQMGCKVYFNPKHSKDYVDRKETLKRLKIKPEITNYNNLWGMQIARSYSALLTM